MTYESGDIGKTTSENKQFGEEITNSADRLQSHLHLPRRQRIEERSTTASQLKAGRTLIEPVDRVHDDVTHRAEEGKRRAASRRKRTRAIVHV